MLELEPRLLPSSLGALIERLYVEALDRLPDVPGYMHWSTHTPLAIAQGVYSSSEYNAEGLDHSTALVTLYRSLMRREPDLNGFMFWLHALNAGLSPASVAGYFATSPEFETGVGFIASTPLGFGMSEQQLQEALNLGSVTLPAESVVRLTQPLTVPANRVLSSLGSGASAARLVRDAAFSAPLLLTSPGDEVSHLWLDGRASTFGYAEAGTDLSSAGGSYIHDNRFSDATGSAVVRLGYSYLPGDVLYRNLITTYTLEGDGISTTGPTSVVAYNAVGDAGDVGIVVFGVPNAVQSSQVYGNVVANFSHHANAAIALCPTSSADFTGCNVSANFVWGDTPLTFGIAIGTKEWNNPLSVLAPTVSANVIAAPATWAFAIDGADHATITHNIGTPYIVTDAPSLTIDQPYTSAVPTL